VLNYRPQSVTSQKTKIFKFEIISYVTGNDELSVLKMYAAVCNFFVRNKRFEFRNFIERVSRRKLDVG
jgi:hypothetical protein